MSRIHEALAQIDRTGRVESSSISSLLDTVYQELRFIQTRATELDARLDGLRLLARSFPTSTLRFSSPASILAGGIVRDIAGVVTLPEVRRSDAIHGSDGQVRASLSLLDTAGLFRTSGDPQAAFDNDTSTSWQIEADSVVVPTTVLEHTGPVDGAYMILVVQFDIPQWVSQLEIGVLGDPVRVLRVEDGQTGEVIWAGSVWANPGALIFFDQRVFTQSIRIGILQPHYWWTGRHYHYRTILHTLRILDVEYADSSDVYLPELPISSVLLSPHVRAEGEALLEVDVNGTWTDASAPLTLPELTIQEAVEVSSDNTVYLSQIPLLVSKVLFRNQIGQTTEVSVASVKISGRSVTVPGIQGPGLLYVTYTYRPTEVSCRIRLSRGSLPAWKSPVVHEVTL